MKTLLTGISGITFLFLFLSLQVGVSSCTKEVIEHDTVTVIKKDTVVQIKKDTLIIKDTSLTTEILTKTPWEIKEYRGVEGGSIVYYLRGGSNNTMNFDKENIVFRADKTGTYYDAYGYPSSLVWNFANSENTKLVYTVNFPAPGPTVVTWENIVYKNNILKFDQYWTQNSVNEHSQIIRTAKQN